MNKINLAKSSKSSSNNSKAANIETQVTFMMFFTNGPACIAIISSWFAMIFMLFYEPVFIPYVEEQYGLKEDIVGLVLALGCLSYAVGCPVVAVISKKMPRKYLTGFSFIFIAGSLILAGPSYWLLGIKPNLAMTLIGWVGLSFSCAFTFVPLLPEMIEEVGKKEGLEDSPSLADKAAALYNVSYGVGNFIAPIIGGYISTAYGNAYRENIL